MKGIRTSRLFILSSICLITFFSSVVIHSGSNVKSSFIADPAKINGRILVTSISSLKVSVLLQLNTTSGLDAMGGATIIIGFDTSALSFKANPIKNTDYFFHNFCGGNYSPATVTRPINNRIWLNVDLPFQNCHEGTVIAGGSNWTDMVTINFDVVDQDGLINVYWLYDSPFWGIYDDDNSTFWNIGQFTDALNIPLPVELSSFAAKIADDKVELDWTTESEVNNYGFDVERKADDNKWILLGFVAGNGNTNTPKSYYFVDNSLSGGSNFYYRLKQIDTDGNFEYSEIVEVELVIDNFALHQNFPNPFNPTTKIEFRIVDFGFVSLKVYDVLGNEVATIVNEEKNRGVYSIDFYANILASGIYFYRLSVVPTAHRDLVIKDGQAGGFVETKKMILLK
jgi:hypothetical protein